MKARRFRLFEEEGNFFLGRGNFFLLGGNFFLHGGKISLDLKNVVLQYEQKWK